MCCYLKSNPEKALYNQRYLIPPSYRFEKELVVDAMKKYINKPFFYKYCAEKHLNQVGILSLWMDSDRILSRQSRRMIIERKTTQYEER